MFVFSPSNQSLPLPIKSSRDFNCPLVCLTSAQCAKNKIFKNDNKTLSASLNFSHVINELIMLCTKKTDWRLSRHFSLKGDYLKTRAGIEERYVLRPNLSAWQAVKVNQEGTSFLGSRFFLNLSENERIPSNIGGTHKQQQWLL